MRNCLILLLLLFPFNIWGQVFTPDPDWRFENFNSYNHFKSYDIGNVALDKLGYLWSASAGAQRFDGFRFTNYTSFSGKAGTLKGSYTDLITDPYGRVWVSSDGICYFDNATGQFVYIQPKGKAPLTYAYAISVQKNTLWFVCDYGLAKLNLQTLKITLTSLKAVNNAMYIWLLDDHTLFVSSAFTYYLYDIYRDTYVTRYGRSGKKFTYINNMVKRGPDRYVTTNNGLFLIKNSGTLKLPDTPLINNSVTDILFMPQDKQKRYLFLSSYNGLIIYDTFLNRITNTYVSDANNMYSLINNNINRLYLDNKQRLWISTSVGLSMLDLNDQRWKMRYINKDNTEHAIFRINRDMDDTNKVWISSYNTGLIHINWKSKKNEQVINPDGKFQFINDFAQINKNRMLLINSGVLTDLDITTGKFILPGLTMADIGSYGLRYIIKADTQTCYISTSYGLLKYNLLTRQISLALQNGDPHQHDELRNGFYDKGVLWIAKSGGGLFYIDTQKGTSVLYKDTKDVDSYFFEVSPSANNLLICPSINGFAFFNKQTKKFKHVYNIANLTNLKCLTATTVNNVVWIGTEAGIVTYDINTGQSAMIINQGPQFEIFPRSPFALVNNDLVLGFRDGYTYFSPDLKNMPSPSDPVIESFSVNNKLVPYCYNYQKQQQLIFDHTNNSVNIAFTAFLYSDPDNVNFRYRLKGADNKWQYTKSQRSANFAQLRPGNYTFDVQSGNSNNTWNNHLASVSFIIKPAFWETWWFRTLIVIALAAGLYAIYRYKIQHLKAIESIRQGIASDFHDDLGSTLSSISIFSEVASKKAETDLNTTKTMVDDIGLRARSMIQSMNDMVWTIKPENDTLYMLLQRMEEFSYPVAEAKEIQLQFFMDESLYTVKTDMIKRKSLFLIFKEAFNNSVKYSGANKVEVQFKLKSAKTIVMQITDNGCGFNFGDIKAGNGLVNMKKRAAEIKADLKINTTPGRGTEIHIICKIA